MESIKKCCLCELCKTRTQVVIGSGNLTSPIMLVGEAPGKNEDIKGIPFIGLSGQFLRKTLQSLSLMDNVYITNIVKCRPPENRDPNEFEIEKCFPYLLEQIEIIKPNIVIGIGRISSEIIHPGYIQKIHHGRFFAHDNFQFMGTYHPSAALRNSDFKEKMIADLTLLKSYCKTKNKFNIY